MDTNVHNRLRLSSDLPKYSGAPHEDLLTWLDATYVACMDEDIQEEEMVSVRKRFLTDDALICLRVESGLVEQSTTTFAGLAAGLKDCFLPAHHGADLWRKLNRQFRKLAKQVRDTLNIDELITHTYLETLKVVVRPDDVPRFSTGRSMSCRRC